MTSISWNEDGLAPAIAQDALSGEVRMLAFATQEALDATLATGFAHFYSRSRKKLWKKGESSGNTLAVREVRTDCDGDALLYLVQAQGPTCHTGEESCFFHVVNAPSDQDAQRPLPALARLFATLQQRRSADGHKSYTRTLLDGGPTAIAAKIQEEAIELGEALKGETRNRVVAETADVIYHALVGLVARDVHLRDVESELERRFSRSGLAEKAARKP